MSIEVRSYRPGSELEAVADDVWKLLCAADETFVPPLSQRLNVAMHNLKPKVLSPETLWGGPVSYFESVMTQTLALAYIEGAVTGIISWKDHHRDELLPEEFNPCFRITTIGTHPDYVNQGVATAMVSFVREIAKASKTKWIVGRLWSDAAGIPMYERCGFRVVHTITDHRGAGVDSVYLGCENS